MRHASLSRWIRPHLFGVVAIAFVSTLAAAPAVAAGAPEFAAGTEFTYQGKLRQHGEPAEGLFDLSFLLFDASRDGQSFGQIDLFDVPVHDGSFAVELDFRQPIFSGEPHWLEVQVRVAGAGAYASLEPRDLLVGKGTSTCTVNSDVLIAGRLDVEPTSDDPAVNLLGCNEADLDSGGQIALHCFFGTLRIDHDEIQSTALNTPNIFQINPHGGNIGLGVSNPTAPVQVPGGPDVTASGGGSLVIGLSTNIAIDQNEIQAHSAGAPSTLFLNNSGGVVRTGGDAVVAGSLGIGIQLVEVTANSSFVQAHCPSGKSLISGGCSGGDISWSRPDDSNTWDCFFDDSTDNTAVAVCGRVTW